MGKVLHKTLSTWGKSTFPVSMEIALEGWKIRSQRRLDGIWAPLCEGQDQPDISLGRKDVPLVFVGERRSFLSGRSVDETWPVFKAKEANSPPRKRSVFWKGLDVYWAEGLGYETSMEPSGTMENLGKLCSYFPTIFPHFPVGRQLFRSAWKHD